MRIGRTLPVCRTLHWTSKLLQKQPLTPSSAWRGRTVNNKQQCLTQNRLRGDCGAAWPGEVVVESSAGGRAWSRGWGPLSRSRPADEEGKLPRPMGLRPLGSHPTLHPVPCHAHRNASVSFYKIPSKRSCTKMGRVGPCSSRKTLDECSIPRHGTGYSVGQVFAKSGVCTAHQRGSESPVRT